MAQGRFQYRLSDLLLLVAWVALVLGLVVSRMLQLVLGSFASFGTVLVVVGLSLVGVPASLRARRAC